MAERLGPVARNWSGRPPAIIAFTNQATISAGGWMRPFQGTLPTAGSEGAPLPFACRIVGLSALRMTTGSSTTWDIYAGAAGTTLVKSHTLAAGSKSDVESGISIDLAAGDLLNVKCNTAMTGGGHLWLFVVYDF